MARRSPSKADEELIGMIGGIALLFLVICAIPFLLPREAWRSWRRWRKLAKQGRVISWSDAVERASGGAATFIVETAMPYPYLEELWMAPAPLRELDPDGAMPRWTPCSPRAMFTTERYPSRSARKRLNEWAPVALRVRFHVWSRGRISEALKGLPTIHLNEFAAIASSGKAPVDPFDVPLSDSGLEKLRLDRERLLDCQEQCVRNAEYERAALLRDQVAAIERFLRTKLNL